MSRNQLAIRPRLNDCGGDPLKRWFVFYSYRNPSTGKMVRFKQYGGFDRLNSAEEKIAHSKRLIIQINRKLDSGWSPFLDQEKFLYNDVLEYQNSAGSPETKKQSEFTVEYYFNLVLSELKPQIRKSSFQAYQSQIRIFIKWLRDNELINCDITELSRDHFKRFLLYLQQNGRNNTTRNNYLTNLKTFIGVLVKENILTENHLKSIPSIPQSKESKRAFTRTQIKQLKPYLKRIPELWLFVQMMYYTFIRPRELRFLKISDIELEGSKIRIRGEISKNKKSQYVAIPRPLLRQLIKMKLYKYCSESYLFGKGGRPSQTHQSKNFYYKLHQIQLKEIGYPSEYSLYSWKHTGVKEAAINGMSLKELQLQLRHHSLDQVDTYLKGLGILESENLRNRFPEI